MRTLNRLSMGEKVAGICSIALLVLSFVKMWATYTVFGDSTGASALDGDAFGILPKLAILFALIATVVFVMRAMGKGPANASTLYLALGGLAFVCLLITVFTGPEDITKAIEDELGGISLGDLGGTIEQSRGILLYIGTLLAAGIAVGGFMSKGETGATTGMSDPAAPSM